MAALSGQTREAYVAFLRTCGDDEQEAFRGLALPVLRRVVAQMDEKPLGGETERALLDAIWDTAARVGLAGPRDLDYEDNTHLDLDEFLGDAVFEVLTACRIPNGALKRHFQYMIANQFLRALVHPEVRACTLSFREQNEDHFCERQSLAHCKLRIAGSNCEECPFYVSLSPKQHLRTLKMAWHLAPETLEENVGVYMAEDFRELRTFLHLRSLYGASCGAGGKAKGGAVA